MNAEQCAEADPACFLRLRSPKVSLSVEDFFFFLNFLYAFETHDYFNISCKVSWRIRFDDTSFSFSMVKSLFLHLVLLNVCKI